MSKYRYIGTEHPSHTGKLVEVMGGQFGAVRVKVLNEKYKVEGFNKSWSTSILCNWDDLKVVDS